MSFLLEVQLGGTFGSFVGFQENFGFVPDVFRAQSLRPRVIEVQAHIPASIETSTRVRGSSFPLRRGSRWNRFPGPYQHPLSIGFVRM